MNPFHSKSSALMVTAVLGFASFAMPLAGRAQSSYTITAPTADAFLAYGTNGNLAGLNFGSAGTLAIAPASSSHGEFDTIMEFNTSAAFSSFNTTYGAGNWTITGVKLSLASSTFGTQGAGTPNGIFNNVNAGGFNINWLAGNSWAEGTGNGNGTAGYPNNSFVDYNDIANLLAPGLDPLGSFNYSPPGNNVYANYSLSLDANLVSEAADGGNISLYLDATNSAVSYLFNSRNNSSDAPELVLTVVAVPEPGTMALVAVALGCLMAARRAGGRSKR